MIEYLAPEKPLKGTTEWGKVMTGKIIIQFVFLPHSSFIPPIPAPTSPYPGSGYCPVEMDEVGLFQVIQNRGDGLAGGAGNVRNVLLGKAVFDQHLVSDAFTVFISRFFEKLDDPFTGVFENERFEAAFGFCKPAVGNKIEDGWLTCDLFHELLEVGYF